MKVTPRNIRKFQVGGPMSPEEVPVEETPVGAPTDGGMETEAPAPEAGGGEDPIMMLAQMSMLALQGLDCQMAMQVCQAFLQIIQEMQGGGGAPAEPLGEPVFRKGGRLAYRIKK